MNPLAWLVLKVLRLYQLCVSPLFPQSCKYYPSCSNYAVEAIRVNGVVRGLGQAVWRLLRCNPWSRGGVDFPPNSNLAVPIPEDREDSNTPLNLKVS